MTKLNAIDFFDYLQENVSNNDKEEVIINTVNNYFIDFTDKELTTCIINIIDEYDNISNEYKYIQKKGLATPNKRTQSEVLDYCLSNSLEFREENNKRNTLLLTVLFNYCCIPVYRMIDIDIFGNENNVYNIYNAISRYIMKEIDKCGYDYIQQYAKEFIDLEIYEESGEYPALVYNNCSDLLIVLCEFKERNRRKYLEELEENKNKYNVKNT